METPEWRHFETMDLRAAYAWAARGNVALHDSGREHCGQRAYHLLCQPLERLHAMAESLGVKRCWYEGDRRRHERRHYDVFGAALDRALDRCQARSTSVEVGLTQLLRRPKP